MGLILVEGLSFPVTKLVCDPAPIAGAHVWLHFSCNDPLLFDVTRLADVVEIVFQVDDASYRGRFRLTRFTLGSAGSDYTYDGAGELVLEARRDA
jgi:hypothetical protein